MKKFFQLLEKESFQKHLSLLKNQRLGFYQERIFPSWVELVVSMITQSKISQNQTNSNVFMKRCSKIISVLEIPLNELFFEIPQQHLDLLINQIDQYCEKKSKYLSYYISFNCSLLRYNLGILPKFNLSTEIENCINLLENPKDSIQICDFLFKFLEPISKQQTKRRKKQSNKNDQEFNQISQKDAFNIYSTLTDYFFMHQKYQNAYELITQFESLQKSSNFDIDKDQDQNKSIWIRMMNVKNFSSFILSSRNKDNINPSDYETAQKEPIYQIEKMILQKNMQENIILFLENELIENKLESLPLIYLLNLQQRFPNNNNSKQIENESILQNQISIFVLFKFIILDVERKSYERIFIYQLAKIFSIWNQKTTSLFRNISIKLSTKYPDLKQTLNFFCNHIQLKSITDSFFIQKDLKSPFKNSILAQIELKKKTIDSSQNPILSFCMNQKYNLSHFFVDLSFPNEMKIENQNENNQNENQNEMKIENQKIVSSPISKKSTLIDPISIYSKKLNIFYQSKNFTKAQELIEILTQSFPKIQQFHFDKIICKYKEMEINNKNNIDSKELVNQSITLFQEFIPSSKFIEDFSFHLINSKQYSLYIEFSTELEKKFQIIPKETLLFTQIFRLLTQIFIPFQNNYPFPKQIQQQQQQQPPFDMELEKEIQNNIHLFREFWKMMFKQNVSEQTNGYQLFFEQESLFPLKNIAFIEFIISLGANALHFLKSGRQISVDLFALSRYGYLATLLPKFENQIFELENLHNLISPNSEPSLIRFTRKSLKKAIVCYQEMRREQEIEMTENQEYLYHVCLGDVYFSNADYFKAISSYISASFRLSKMFQNQDHLLKSIFVGSTVLEPLVFSLKTIGADSYVAILSQFTEPVDYSLAFKSIKQVAQGFEPRIFQFFWDTTILEMLANYHKSLGFDDLVEKINILIAQKERNKHNPQEIRLKFINRLKVFVFKELFNSFCSFSSDSQLK
ncbi:hypothetical protein M0811_09175 [Anaeramoeba ignava]|uniref:INTS8 TPR repeats domain-containing protein n=1 Tax=Anaeramoeba ignava TaxID=1746090 RepID=A0A9Q0LHU6_ANAIG|nr:hypothetical protein M0811_09175 [Anaeramoeba ignava]